MVKIIEYHKHNTRLYKFRLYVGDGKYVKRTGFTSIKQARNEAINIKSQVLKGTYFKPKATKVNDIFDEWYKLYCKTVRESTAATLMNCYSNHIKGKIGNKSIKNLDVRTLQKVVNDLSTETTSQEIFRKYINIIDRLLRYAIRQDIIRDNPLNKVITPRIQEPKKPLNCYDKEQLKTLLSYLKHEENLQYYMLFKTLAYTGMRIGELIALTWQDIGFIKGTIDINKTVS
ncbi:tyrosine-type recombinase/integrase, partial [Lactobacillus salivarius]|nr:tyrosine-type recombinase/integrase [Ligilactobacillus salivarius]